jgi:hypothetical protein
MNARITPTTSRMTPMTRSTWAKAKVGMRGGQEQTESDENDSENDHDDPS